MDVFFAEKNSEVICGGEAGSSGMPFAVKNDEFGVRTAKKAASSFASVRLVEFEQITHWRSVSLRFLLQPIQRTAQR